MLTELQTHLEDEDPGWVRQFEKFPPSQASYSVHRNRLLDLTIGVQILLVVLGLLFGSLGVVVVCGAIAAVTVRVRFRV